MNFEYTPVTPPNAIFKISPSSIGKFYNYPSTWYKEEVLGEEKQFKNSTSTILGTVIHAIAEEYGKHQKLPSNYQELCNNFIDKEYRLNKEIDPKEIKKLYPEMAENLIQNYLLDNLPSETEKQIYTEVKDDIYVGGTVDAIVRDPITKTTTVVDYKNVGTKPSGVEKPTYKLPFDYKIQLLAYAYILKQNGEKVNNIRIVYTVRPTKTFPARIYSTTHKITNEDWNLIKSVLTIIADSVIKASQDNECAALIFKSMQFKNSNNNLLQGKSNAMLEF
jgi:CRISPR/Cas system-associated exonuclease Cas4 (RecB family)